MSHLTLQETEPIQFGLVAKLKIKTRHIDPLEDEREDEVLN